MTTLQSLMASGVDASDIYVLTKEGLAELTKEIFKNVNNRIQERIVTDVNDQSDVGHVPSANTVFNAVKNLSKIKNLVIASGNINEATIQADQNTLYIVRRNSTDVNGNIYIWLENIGYINCGGAETNDDDQKINAIPNEEISKIVNDSYNDTNPGLNSTSLKLD